MTLQLVSIAFNYDQTSAANSAINIRRNRDYEIPIPEFSKETIWDFNYNCAAYAIAETLNETVYIQVEFATLPTTVRTYEVKATGGGIMGNLDPIQIVFENGAATETNLIPLTHRTFSKIGAYDITWEWSYRIEGSNSWIRLQTSHHRIYLVLTIPPAPWTQDIGDYHNPWGDLLNDCCVIAAGSEDSVTTTRKIAKKVYSNYNLRYDTIQGRGRYCLTSSGPFSIDNWIDYVIRGNVPDNPRFCPGTPEDYPDKWIVNCYDCAAALSFMAKILGANTGYNFHDNFGYLNYVEPIGRGKCNNPFYGCSGTPAVGPDDPRSGFGNHAYTKLNGQTYDACMKQWLSSTQKAILWLIILIIIIFSCGQRNIADLLDRVGGWLLNLSQNNYEEFTIDTSESFEATVATGTPYPRIIDF